MSNEQKFQEIYQANYQKVSRLCVGYVSGNKDLAKDLAQEVFLKVWQNLTKFRGNSRIETWIYRITVNTCLQELRKRKTLRLQPNLLAQEAPSESETENRFNQMYRCINKLSPDNKAIILLELEDVPQQDIASITGIAHQAVRTRIHRIKEQLSKCVKDE